MADENANLPEGTDKVIEGASGATTMTTDTTLIERDIPEARLGDRVRSGADKLSSQAGEKARGLVGQGLERSAEALANVARLVGDTAPGIEERLGADYGDFARRAATGIENTANAIAGKNPDELIEDTRNFVRNSPGIALAGAAVVGFVFARLLKTGLGKNQDDDED